MSHKDRLASHTSAYQEGLEQNQAGERVVVGGGGGEGCAALQAAEPHLGSLKGPNVACC